MNLPPYVAVTTAKNEQCSIEKTIDSVLNQSHPPLTYVVVDDNSRDDTLLIIKQKPVIPVHIKKLALPVRSYNMLRGLLVGIDRATKEFPSWNFLLKVDADTILPENYVEKLMSKLLKNNKIGIASGVMNNRLLRKTRPSDGAKIYRRECWDEIKGLDFVVGWDTHATLKAMKEGWITRAFPDISYLEKRESKKKSLKSWMQIGFNRYYLGFPLFHSYWTALEYMNDYPYFFGSIILIISHFIALLTRNRTFQPDYYESVKKIALWELMERVLNKCYL